MNWPEGLREEWLGDHQAPAATDWTRRARGLGASAQLLAIAPENIARPFLAKWGTRRLVTPRAERQERAWTKCVIARFEVDALQGVRQYLVPGPAAWVELALPFSDPHLAAAVAHAFWLRPDERAHAERWLLRHPQAALIGLIPACVGVAKGRQSARHALMFLLARGHRELLLELSARYDGECRAAVQQLAQLEPLDLFPDRPPAIPEWARRLDPPALHAGDPLSDESFHNLLSMLVLCRPRYHYAGVGSVAGSFDAASLAAFSWRLYEAWREANTKKKHGWALWQLGALGDGECARRLVHELPAAHHAGLAGHGPEALVVLGEIGTPRALLHLADIAYESKLESFRRSAKGELLALSPDKGDVDELLDRLVIPGRTSIDVQLFERVHARRLERAMVARRSWGTAEFWRDFVEAPQMQNLVEGILFCELEGDMAGSSFRISAGELVDSNDESFEMSTSRAAVLHPIDLSADTSAAWSEIFADHEIAQPFSQLFRSVYGLSEDEATKGRIDRLDKMRVTPAQFDELASRGWRLVLGGANGATSGAERDLPSGSQLVLYARQKGAWVFLARVVAERDGKMQQTLKGACPRAISEALRDIEALREVAVRRP